MTTTLTQARKDSIKEYKKLLALLDLTQVKQLFAYDRAEAAYRKAFREAFR